MANILEFVNKLELSTAAKIKLLEHAVEQYKNEREEKIELKEGVEARQKAIEELDGRLNGVGNLIQIQQRLAKEIKRFDSIKADAELKNKVTLIKNNRISYVYNVLKSIKTSVYNGITTATDLEERSFLVGKIIFLPLFLILIFTILIFYVRQDNRLLYLGFGAFVLEMLLLFSVNILNISTKENVKGLGVDYLSDEDNTFELLISKLDRREGKFLVDAAWLGAITAEKQRLDDAITIKLGGTPMSEIENKKQVLRNEIEANELRLDTITNSLLTAEEYLKIRRELDILKIENDDNSAEDQAVMDEIRSLNIKIDSNDLKEGSFFKRFLISAQSIFHFSVS